MSCGIADPALLDQAKWLTGTIMELSARFSRARFRAWHRGTREADYMIGGYFDRYHTEWSEADLQWFEALLDEDDVEIMAWALKAQPAPERFAGTLMQTMQKLDYVTI